MKPSFRRLSQGITQPFWNYGGGIRKRVFKTAYRITGKREDAEDVIQDAWIKAYLHLNTFDGRAKFATWLTRIDKGSR